MPNGKLEREVAGRLADRGVRFTRGRRAVVAALAAADGPRAAAELHADLGSSVPLSSLYRSLAVLETAGIVAPHHGTKGLTRYELAEWLAGHHHHLVCIDCGAVDDIHLSPALEDRLEQVVTGVIREAGFVAGGHSLEIDGRCARCA